MRNYFESIIQIPKLFIGHFIGPIITIILFWIFGYGYTFYNYFFTGNYAWWHILICTTLLLLLITFLSVIPLLIYVLFMSTRLQQTYMKTIEELRHYNLLTDSVRDEILYASTRTYEPRNYTIAIPLATLSVGIGWILFFFWPGSTNIAHFFITGDFQLLLIAESFHPLVFGFLGAVFWYEGTLFHRFKRGDLTDTVFISVVERILVVFLLALVLSVCWPGYQQPWQGVENVEMHKGLLALAFIIGIFPRVGLELIKKIAITFAGAVKIISREKLSLDMIQGLDLWDQGRLTEEGIDNVQNLAESDVFGLIVNTRLGIMALLNWIDQALLIMHVGKDLETFKSIGINTATDFEAAYVAQLPLNSQERINIEIYLNQKNLSCLYSYMGREGISEVPDPPDSLISALGGEKSLKGRAHTMMCAICDDIKYQRLWQIRHGKLFKLIERSEIDKYKIVETYLGKPALD